MKKTLLSLVALLTVSTSVVSAQEFQNPKREFNYGFISAAGGTLVYYGDYTSTREFGDRMAPIMDVSLGKMFNPYIGVRLQWSGWNAFSVGDGQSKFNGLHLRNSTDRYENDFYLNYAHVDFLWNLSNSFGKPKEKRFWDFVPYLGAGWVNASEDGSYPGSRLGINAGVLQQFRLSPSVDVLLDVRAMGTNRNIDDAVAAVDPMKFDMTLSASLGVAYNIGRTRSKVVAAPVDFSSYENRIGALERDLNASQARANQLARDLEAERAKEKSTVVNNVVAAKLAVWFDLNKSTLTEKEKINLGYIADAIKSAGGDKVYEVYGAADSETGSPVRNKALADARAKVVYDELVKNGVKESQLRLNPVGGVKAGSTGAFDKALLNRVSIVGK
jgi:outer membrane protein OmpA-like peptidoglycan-associated protein